MSDYLAHSRNRFGKLDYVQEHLQKVADRAARFAATFGASEEARLAGLLHDLGKYGDLFQKRLRGETRHIDHWSVGAGVAITKVKALGAALAIQGHHTGLQQAYKDQLSDLIRWVRQTPGEKRNGLSLSESNFSVLWERFEEDNLSLPKVRTGIYPQWSTTVAAMLDVRMLYSALVDADFIETEAHFEGRYRETGPPLDADKGLAMLTQYVERLGRSASTAVLGARDDLRGACLDAATQSPGLFTLTAPTGTGKTLSMLAFALRHAQIHNLQRVVMVIPYLTIIDQTASEYRKVFKDQPNLDQYVIEHHSLAGTRPTNREEDAEEVASYLPRLLAENWDAPIIVTTSVQMLESLFANRPGPCRKLHRLARSVILFDEVQTIPVKLVIPTLATLSHLSSRYGATVVFSTATQPAFGHLDKHIRELCMNGWKPQEIVPHNLILFSRTRRTRLKWLEREKSMTWDELAEELLEQQRSLCIVNMKRHAVALYDTLRNHTADLFHLSTSMCPAHRKVVLDTVHKRLNNKKPCILVSTQCVEAGVDIDFPTVYRELAPLDAIAQAAGRCNRNGKGKEGIVTIFVPQVEDDSSRYGLYPDGAYRQGASITKSLVTEAQGDLDINEPSVYERYYRVLYDTTQPQNQNPTLIDAIKRQDFVAAAQEYRVIKQDTINVLVPYDEEMFELLCDEVRETGLKRDWIFRARPYTIGIYRPKRDDPVWQWLEPVRIYGKEEAKDWCIYTNKMHYTSDKGFVSPSSWEFVL